MHSRQETGTVYFIGAGPGDPELLTLKGKRCIEEAALVLYAGSLVPLDVVACASSTARVVDSAPLTLEQCHALMRQVALDGGMVARVHTGDPSLYGTLREQARLLDADAIPWRVVPGVTSACAAAAAAGISFTVPEVTQSLVFTRLAGRTPVPEKERLRHFARIGCSLAVYLSAGEAESLQEELCAMLPPETVVVCAYRVGWPDEALYRATAETVAEVVRAHGLTRQTLFLVLPGEQTRSIAGASAKTDVPATRSRLYAPDFAHGWRPASE